MFWEYGADDNNQLAKQLAESLGSRKSSEHSSPLPWEGWMKASPARLLHFQRRNRLRRDAKIFFQLALALHHHLTVGVDRHVLRVGVVRACHSITSCRLFSFAPGQRHAIRPFSQLNGGDQTLINSGVIPLIMSSIFMISPFQRNNLLNRFSTLDLVAVFIISEAH
jgi:hypothetical protein